MARFNKFLNAQKESYDDALAEMRRGRKKTHWMWFVFPQLKGLGQSWTSDYFGLDSLADAKDYLRHPLLRSRLEEISRVVYDLDAADISKVFGYPDTLKFQSSMTLFALADPDNPIYQKNLDRYFEGQMCQYTVEMCRKESDNV